MSSLPEGAPAPRLCIITKWPDFEGYGFNLHAEKSKPGQYIGKVDANSPAEAAGLKEDDRIIEVNGANIANENHKQVVQRIKAVPNETRLLVVDPPTDKYYKGKNIVVRGSQENVIVGNSSRDQKRSATPEPSSQLAAAVSNGHHDEADNRSVSSAASSSATSEVSTQPQSPMSTSPTPPPSLEPAPAAEPTRNSPSPKPSATTTTTTTKNANNASPKPRPASNNNNAYNSSGLNLNMSAAEMRAKLASKKKADPRRESVDLKKKYEIIQNM